MISKDLLPIPARDLLVAASKVDDHLPAGESVKRTYVIDNIVREIRVMCPQFFREEDD